MNVSTATTAELMVFFNANTGGAPVKKFADRKTAERRVQALLDEIAADEVIAKVEIIQRAIAEAHPDSIDAAYREIAAREAEGEDMTGATVDPVTTAIIKPMAESRLINEYGAEVCPHCGIDLRNGVGQHLQEVNGTYIKHEKLQYACLGCGQEFGPEIVRRSPSGKPVTPRPAMSQSLKLDRRITCVDSGKVYANACQVWKDGLVSASQGDRLSATLYGAAKAGNRLMSLTINGHVFALTAQ